MVLDGLDGFYIKCSRRNKGGDDGGGENSSVVLTGEW